MAALKINRDQLKFIIPLVIPYARQLAGRTETKLDDRAVDAIEIAVTNPVVFDFLWAMLTGEQPAVTPQSPQISAMESVALESLEAKADAVKAVFALADY